MMIRVDVTDTGIGIAEKDMALLFEAFRQVDLSLTRTQGGTGLGLPISKSLVEMQSGRDAGLVQSQRRLDLLDADADSIRRTKPRKNRRRRPPTARNPSPNKGVDRHR